MCLVPVEIKDRTAAPGLESLKVVCDHMSAGNTTQIYKSSKCSQLQSHLSNPDIQYLMER